MLAAERIYILRGISPYRGSKGALDIRRGLKPYSRLRKHHFEGKTSQSIKMIPTIILL